MSHTQLSWIFELLWLVFAAVVTALVLLPVYGVISQEYLVTNAANIFLSVTFFRLFLFLKKVPYLTKLWMRVILVALLGILFFQFMFRIQDFLWDMDNATMSRFLTPAKAFEHSQNTLDSYQYFRDEFILFAVACQLMILLLAIRLVVSMWQYGPKVSMNR